MPPLSPLSAGPGLCQEARAPRETPGDPHLPQAVSTLSVTTPPGRSSSRRCVGGGLKPKWVGAEWAGPTPPGSNFPKWGEGALGSPSAQRGCKETPGQQRRGARDGRALTVRRSDGREAIAPRLPKRPVLPTRSPSP